MKLNEEKLEERILEEQLGVFAGALSASFSVNELTRMLRFRLNIKLEDISTKTNKPDVACLSEEDPQQHGEATMKCSVFLPLTLEKLCSRFLCMGRQKNPAWLPSTLLP